MPLAHTVEEISLKNGARGLLVTTPGATSVRYSVQFRAGNCYVEDRSVSQTAHLMEHMAFGPNAEFASMEAFSREFSKNGAYHNAYTSGTDMVYSAGAALMEWERILRLQLMAIAKPVFTEESLVAEKGNVREEIVGYAGNHGRLLWQEMANRAGLDRWLDARELKTIDAVTLEDINRHYKKTHTPENMRFVIVGDLAAHRDTIIDLFEQTFPTQSHGRLPLPVDAPHGTDLVTITRKDLPSITFTISFFLNRTLTRAELRAVSVLTHILTDTFHSRIWGKARARGICYGMGSWISSEATQLTEFGLGGQVSVDNTAELFTLIADELVRTAREGITEDELIAAKEYRLGGLQMGTETTASLASWYMGYYYEMDEIDYVERMPELINATTVEEITTILREIIATDAWSFGVIGNIEEDQIRPQYTEFKRIIETFKKELV